MRLRSQQSGQAIVETAIVMPLMVFLMLGTLQMNLLYQARLMTEYAAFRAARAGALDNGNIARMEAVALSVLVAGNAIPAGSGGVRIPRVDSAGSYVAQLAILRGANTLLGDSLEIADVRICGPTRNEVGGTYKRRRMDGGAIETKNVVDNGEVDFDDWRRASYSFEDGVNPSVPEKQAIERLKRGKLRIQVTYNYVMPIPFANQVLSRIWLGQQLVETLRLQRRPLIATGDIPTGPNAQKMPALAAAALAGVYVMPLRAEYNMRMQSNLYRDNLPTANDCVTWGKQ